MEEPYLGDLSQRSTYPAALYEFGADALMQTFLPYSDFADSAAVLDRQRLGKQRVETYQIMRVLILGNKKGWTNHPAVKMWRGHEMVLMKYQEAVCDEWMERGFKDTCLDKSRKLYADNGINGYVRYPGWINDEAFHRSHQSNLIRKAPEIYALKFPGVPDNLEYVWPVP